MPLAHLRVCEPCGDRIRYAPCSTTCRAPDPRNPKSWHPNLQDGAGTITQPR